ncbi:hypothetical protein C8R46DRAFT_1092821 [Mycena filopes]|nr:hypothetical protein C8R46DRAFT_1092821 [Mycena filopes]
MTSLPNFGLSSETRYVSELATALDAARKRIEELEKEKESTFSSSNPNLESPAARMAVAELAGQVLSQNYERVNDVMREQLDGLQGTINELMSQQPTPLQSQDGQRVAALTHENAKEKALNAQLRARIQELEAINRGTHASSGANSTEALQNKELKAMNQELINRNAPSKREVKANSMYPLPPALPPAQAVALAQQQKEQQKELQSQKDLRQNNTNLKKRVAELEKALAATHGQPLPAATASGSKRQLAPGEDGTAASKRRRGDDVEMQ